MKKDLAKTICICKGCKELLDFEDYVETHKK